jgi:hypothetical protein
VPALTALIDARSPRRPRALCFASGCCVSLAFVAALALVVVKVLPNLLAGGSSGGVPDAVAPSALTGLNASSTRTSLALQWAAPDLHGKQLVYFELSTDRSGSFATEPLCQGLAQTCTLTDVAPGTTVHWKVRAVSTACCTNLGYLKLGNWSSVAAASTLPSVAPTDAPSHVRLVVAGDNFAALSWDTLPVYADVASVVHAQVALLASHHAGGSVRAASNCTGTLNWTDVSLSGTTSDEAIIVGLTANSRYCVRVAAANHLGESAWGAPLEVATNARSATVPGAPQAPSTFSVGYTTLTVGWTRPADDGGSEIVGFVVQARELSRRAAAPPHLSAAGHLSAAQNASYSCIGSASASQCELAGLLAGTSYELRVAARNSVGVSAWSPDVTNKTLAPTAPGAPGEPLSSASDPYELVWEAAADHGAVIEAYDGSVRRRSHSGAQHALACHDPYAYTLYTSYTDATMAWRHACLCSRAVFAPPRGQCKWTTGGPTPRNGAPCAMRAALRSTRAACPSRRPITRRSCCPTQSTRCASPRATDRASPRGR